MYPCFVCERNVCQAPVWQRWRRRLSLRWVSGLAVLNRGAALRRVPVYQKAGLRHGCVFPKPVNPLRL